LQNADGDIDFEGLEQEYFQNVLRAAGGTETMQANPNWLELDEGDPGFHLLTEEEIAADVIKDSAMEEESDNELNELKEFTIKKKLLSSARDGTDAVINYVDSSTNQTLQEFYEHLRIVKNILVKEQQQRSVQTKFDSFFKPALLHSKTSTTSKSSIE
jgi:hypothetical protein